MPAPLVLDPDNELEPEDELDPEGELDPEDGATVVPDLLPGSPGTPGFDTPPVPGACGELDGGVVLCAQDALVATDIATAMAALNNVFMHDPLLMSRYCRNTSNWRLFRFNGVATGP